MYTFFAIFILIRRTVINHLHKWFILFVMQVCCCISLHTVPSPNVSNHDLLTSSFNSFNFLKNFILKKAICYISDYLVTILVVKIMPLWNKYPFVYYLILKIEYKFTTTFSVYVNKFYSILIYLKNRFPLAFKSFLFLYSEYVKIVTGNLDNKHVGLLFSVGIYLNDFTYFQWLFIMLLVKVCKDFMLYNKNYVTTNKIFINYVFLYNFVISLLNAIYIISLYNCANIGYEGMIIPLLKTLIIYVNNTKNVVKMASWGRGKSNIDPSSSSNPQSGSNPSPNPPPNPPPNPSSSTHLSDTSSKGKGKKKITLPESQEKRHYTNQEIDDLGLGEEFRRVRKRSHRLNKLSSNHMNNHYMKVSLDRFRDSYFKLLPNDSKEKANSIRAAFNNKGLVSFKGYNTATSVKAYFELIQQDANSIYQANTRIFQIYEENTKKIKNDSLGGVNSDESILFSKELTHLREIFSSDYKIKNDFLKTEINRSGTLDAMLKERGVPVRVLFEKGVLLY